MILQKESVIPDAVAAVLPPELLREITSVAGSRRDVRGGLSEIRVRAGGLSALVVGGRNLPLLTVVSGDEVEKIAGRICHGSLYAFRDEIARGYLPMPCGVRVGLCGQARYEEGRLVGISDLSSLVFRLPRASSETAVELLGVYTRYVTHGLLVYSPPGGGKTTALRSLAGLLGSGASPMRVAVVDERCEFRREDYLHASVDLLRGYTRGAGMEIATRTLSAEVIVIDEIGGEEEALAVLTAARAGIPVVAAAHGGSFEEVRSRRLLEPLFAAGLFDVAVGIVRGAAGYALSVDFPQVEG